MRVFARVATTGRQAAGMTKIQTFSQPLTWQYRIHSLKTKKGGKITLTAFKLST